MRIRYLRKFPLNTVIINDCEFGWRYDQPVKLIRVWYVKNGKFTKPASKIITYWTYMSLLHEIKKEKDLMEFIIGLTKDQADGYNMMNRLREE
jgi:hypothetical protein